MYDSLIFIDQDSDISPEQLADELRRFYSAKRGAPARIDLFNDTVSLRWPTFTLEVGKSCDPHVVEESTEIAAQCAANHPKRDRIAQCKCRFEVCGDDDPEIEHFNDSLFLGEALERLGTVYRFDPVAGEFDDYDPPDNSSNATGVNQQDDLDSRAARELPRRLEQEPRGQRPWWRFW